MKTVRLSVFAFAALALVMSWAGCSKPPETEKESAKKAMEDAISAGAEKYAATDLEAAKKLWETADSQMKEKKYKEARQSYVDAKAAFEKAAAGVESGKRAAVDQARSALNGVEEEWKKLNASAKKMGKKLKEKKQLWKADAKTIHDGLIRVKEKISSAPDEAKAELEELKTMMDKWKNTFREMAKTPAKAKTGKKKKA